MRLEGHHELGPSKWGPKALAHLLILAVLLKRYRALAGRELANAVVSCSEGRHVISRRVFPHAQGSL